MGLYFSSTITCLNCGNSNTFDTSIILFAEENKEITPDDGIRFISKVKPRILCGRCKSDKIRGSDDYFCSVDMTYDHKTLDYVPENLNETWILQDNRQRLPDKIYIDAEHYFYHDTCMNLMLSFSSYDKYLGSKERPQQRVLFYRVKHLSDVQDLYRCDDERYKDCDFCPIYIDRFEDGKTINDYETDEIVELYNFHKLRRKYLSDSRSHT